MKLGVIAIGKPGRGPEATLASDYAERTSLAGRALGLCPLELIDLEPRKPGKAPEAELILKAAEGAHLIACDERGRTYSSRAFADHVAMLRDRGERRLVTLMGCVQSQTQSAALEKAVWLVDDVMGVINLLQVGTARDGVRYPVRSVP